MPKPSRLFHRLAAGRHAGSWLLCAALVFGAGIACTNEGGLGDTGDTDTGDTGIADANVEGTWTLSQTITPGGCDPQRVRNEMAIDQTGNDLVFMFQPVPLFARGSVMGSGVYIDFEFETPSQTTTTNGALVVSADGTQLTGNVTWAITAGSGAPCTQQESWTATRTTTALPPATPGIYTGDWSVTITPDLACPSGETATQLTIDQKPDGTATILGLTTAMPPPVNGFVTGVFLRAAWPYNNGIGTSKTFDAVFSYQSFPVEVIFGDVAHSVTVAGMTCQGQDSYEGLRPPD